MEALPGDPTSLERWTRRYGDIAQSLGAATQGLKSVANDNVFISQAIGQVRADAEQAAGISAMIHARYYGTVSALVGYAAELREAQAQAAEAIELYHQASATQIEALDRKNNAEEFGRAAGTEQPDWLVRVHTAERDAAYAGQEIDAAWARYRSAIGRRDAAARHAIDAIEDSQVQSGLNDTAWNNAAGVVRGVYEFAQDFAPTIISVRDVVKNIADALATASLVVLVLVPIPGVGEIALGVHKALQVVGVALDVAALQMTVVLVILGKQSYRDLVANAIPVVIDAMPGAKVAAKAAGVSGKLLKLDTRLYGLPDNALESGLRYRGNYALTEAPDAAAGAATNDLPEKLAGLLPRNAQPGTGVDDTVHLFSPGQVWNAPAPVHIPSVVLADYLPEQDIDAALNGVTHAVSQGTLPLSVSGTTSW